MQDWLGARARTTPHKLALVMTEGQWTFARLQQTVSETAGMLRGLDVTAGTRVALLLNNGADYVILILAIMRCGGVVVPVNARLSAAEVAYQLENAEVELCLAAPEYHPLLREVVMWWQRRDDRPQSMCFYTTGAVAEAYREHIKPLPAPETYPPCADAEIDLDAPFGIIYTSGTSGKAKGAVLTNGNLFYSALTSAYHLGHHPDDKWLCVLPLYHVGGLSIILRACLYGITIDLRDRFDVGAINHALTREGVTLVSLVPTMLHRLLEARDRPWSARLRLVLLGGAAASAELTRRCRDEGIPLATTYGLSEAASQVATALPELALRKPGTVGRPLLFTQVRVVDEAGRDQPAGAYGEVLVSGLTVMRGYHKDPAATASALRDGWLHTGDIGYFDADGDLWLVQRRSDLIVSGGENLYPAEIEDVLRSHPAVVEAVVVGLDDPEWGQKAAAVVQLAAGHTLTEGELLAYSRERLAGYKQPRVIRFVDELPQTASGKIQRQAVLALFGDT
jgi:o-succinylbenzoate---CoA ligase